jgi:cell division ATPase MinD
VSRVIGIVSGKGGVGKTTFTSNLGIALANLGKKVVIVDCNVTTPHLAHYLGVNNFSVTLNDVFSGKVDITFAPLYCHDVAYIPASGNLNDVVKIDMENLKKYVSKLNEHGTFDFILLDSAPGLGKEAISVLKACDELIFVTTPVIPNIVDATRCAEVASKLGHRKFNVVLNMVRHKEYELKMDQANSLFSVTILGSIPFDESVMDSTALGMPIVWDKPESNVSESFVRIARTLLGYKEIEGIKGIEKIKIKSVFQKISNKLRNLIKRK